MRLSLGLLLVGTVALVACGGDDAGSIRRGDLVGGGTPAGTDPSGTGPTSTTPPAAAACAGVAAAKPISTVDKTARDLHIVNGSVVYQQGPAIIKVDHAGTRSQLYTSPDLVHSFSDEAFIVTVESPDAPDAVLKFMPAGPTTGQDPLKTAPITVTPTTPWNAGGTYVFASDATSFYVLADVTDQGDTIYKLDKQDPNQMTVLAQLNAPLSDPQLVGSDVWFVREQKRVYKVTQAAADPADPTKLPGGDGNATTDSTPTEIFGIGYSQCNLAVGGNHAFCSTGTAVEQRDLTGANVVTVFDSMKGAAPSVLGAAMFGTDTLFVRSLPSSPTDQLKNGIRAVKGTDEKLVACGRDPINTFTADATSIVWAEEGKGVFTAPR